MAHKVRAIEYGTPDGRVRGWWTDCSRSGDVVAAYAVLIPGLRDGLGCPAPWLVEVKYLGRYGHRQIGAYRTLAYARMWALGGNGHVSRGHSSIMDGRVRPMSRPNILALAAAPSYVTPEPLRAPWR